MDNAKLAHTLECHPKPDGMLRAAGYSRWHPRHPVRTGLGESYTRLWRDGDKSCGCFELVVIGALTQNQQADFDLSQRERWGIALKLRGGLPLPRERSKVRQDFWVRGALVIKAPSVCCADTSPVNGGGRHRVMSRGLPSSTARGGSAHACGRWGEVFHRIGLVTGATSTYSVGSVEARQIDYILYNTFVGMLS